MFPWTFFHELEAVMSILKNASKNKWFTHWSPFYLHDKNVNLRKLTAEEEIFNFAHVSGISFYGYTAPSLWAYGRAVDHGKTMCKEKRNNTTQNKTNIYRRMVSKQKEGARVPISSLV